METQRKELRITNLFDINLIIFVMSWRWNSLLINQSYINNWSYFTLC